MINTENALAIIGQGGGNFEWSNLEFALQRHCTLEVSSTIRALSSFSAIRR